MSASFRLKYALGLIPSAKQIDEKWDKLQSMKQALEKMEASEELKHFESMRELLDSSAFQHKKREIQQVQFSGSDEERLLLEVKRLAGDSSIRNYKKLLGSAALERYKTLSKSVELSTFHRLEKIVESPEFSQKRTSVSKKEYKE
ncbi:MAG: hypothetical protein LWW85_14890, partial [Marinilabiliales bacterium]|nr:hypothetical protein [Marinilabiliales bacterium]